MHISNIRNPTSMKNLSTTLPQKVPGDLKLVYSKAMINGSRVITIINKGARRSPYWSLFMVHPLVQQSKEWDSQWFGNYE